MRNQPTTVAEQIKVRGINQKMSKSPSPSPFTVGCMDGSSFPPSGQPDLCMDFGIDIASMFLDEQQSARRFIANSANAQVNGSNSTTEQTPRKKNCTIT